MFLDLHSFADWLTTKLTKPEVLILFFQPGFYVSNSFVATQRLRLLRYRCNGETHRAVSWLRLHAIFHSFGSAKWSFCSASIGGREVTLWVTSRHFGMSDRCPLYPRKRTLFRTSEVRLVHSGQLSGHRQGFCDERLSRRLFKLCRSRPPRRRSRRQSAGTQWHHAAPAD